MKISEHFYSLQGEGLWSGHPSYFIRFFGCNLSCQGFGQKDPKNPETWIQPWKEINIDKISKIEDLPQEIYEYGCDSVYSWEKKFKGLSKDISAEELISEIDPVVLDRIINGKCDIIFTGGEPLLRYNQKYIIELMKPLVSLAEKNDSVINVTIETNGTQWITDELAEVLDGTVHICLTIAVSPKLQCTSGEQSNRAIKPEVVNSYQDKIHPIWLVGKFVVVNTDEAKEEFLSVVKLFNFDIVFLMPEGPNKFRVNNSATEIAEFAMNHGYCFTHRLHNLLWDNKIGV